MTRQPDDYQTHLFSYHFEGGDWGFEIVARDRDEAERRIKHLPWARYDGVLVSRIRAPRTVAPAFSLAIWLRNLFSGGDQ